MAADKRQQKPGDDQETTQVGQQGPSYSSSYNESTPGEVETNRRRALHEQGTNDAPDADRSNASDAE